MAVRALGRVLDTHILGPNVAQRDVAGGVLRETGGLEVNHRVECAVGGDDAANEIHIAIALGYARA